jgi:hypothetical protein
MCWFMWKICSKDLCWEVSSKTCDQHTTFACTVQQLRETGILDVPRRNTGRLKTTCNPEYKEKVLHLVDSIPSASTWQTADIMQTNHMVIWCMLHEQQLHPYHPHRVQAMGPVNFPAWVQFSEWYLRQCNTQPLFPYLVLFMEEACFTCEAMFNSRNSYVWDEDNPLATLLGQYQQQFAASVWAGTVSDQFTGSYLLQIRLNAYTNQQLLQHALPELLRTCRQMCTNWMEHQHTVLMLFTTAWMLHFPSIGLEGGGGGGAPNSGPLQSPDLTPLNLFFLGVTLKLWCMRS